jgi:electron transfer flavoprotein alpha/beta subunit
MKIMVAVKRVIDYAVKIRVKPDKVDLSLSLDFGTEVEWRQQM